MTTKTLIDKALFHIDGNFNHYSVKPGEQNNHMNSLISEHIV